METSQEEIADPEDDAKREISPGEADVKNVNNRELERPEWLKWPTVPDGRKRLKTRNGERSEWDNCGDRQSGWHNEENEEKIEWGERGKEQEEEVGETIVWSIAEAESNARGFQEEDKKGGKGVEEPSPECDDEFETITKQDYYEAHLEYLQARLESKTQSSCGYGASSGAPSHSPPRSFSSVFASAKATVYTAHRVWYWSSLCWKVSKYLVWL